MHAETADFRSIVEAHQDRVLNICYKFLHNREDAEDTAQEVFMEVFRSHAQFRGEAELSTWIHRIAVTKSLDLIRKRKRKKRLGSVKSIISIGEGRVEPTGPPTYRPDTAVEDEEYRQILYRAIDRLPETQKIALTLSRIEGFSYKETAAIMETSLGSVESLVFRAKKNLRTSLSRTFSGRID
ncbi:RNA polymerase sigma factor [bacterium]|nr:RNA polymerase sigma factor [bacterium]